MALVPNSARTSDARDKGPLGTLSCPESGSSTVVGDSPPVSSSRFIGCCRAAQNLFGFPLARGRSTFAGAPFVRSGLTFPSRDLGEVRSERAHRPISLERKG